ncbi:hypothetical protein CWS43_20840 [Rahnella sp. AA]|uniref:hypothetical protein n=1 Tax=Rahnella sp. AA TaxID=2057180 RepID=UPI000C32E31A|nr:hypothetical protein [Rahnella sp. AA]PKE28482.1 hypothetical protein CWS43_20840 [Rahnella sp. AA]
MNAVDLLRFKASSLESKGLLRRAIAVWQDISMDPKLNKHERDQALHSLNRLTDAIQQKTNAEKKKLKSHADRHKNVESDKEKIMQLYQQGLTTNEIQQITQRSRDFIYNCKKKS